MRVNSRVFSERTDMLDNIRIPNCPSQFRTVAENIMAMVTKPGYSVGNYNTMTELDKILMVDYWKEYDGFMSAAYELMYPSKEQAWQAAKKWFVEKATPPELIRRSREFLVSHNYLLIREDVQAYATRASINYRQSLRS